MYDVISIGELVIDFAPVSTDPAGYPTIAAKPGGAPGIFLSALSKYGASTYIYAKVGDDAFGKLLINTLKNAGVDTGGIVEDPEVFTTLAFVAIDETGNRSFSFSRKPGADTCLRPDEVDFTKINGARYLHFDTLPMSHSPSRETTKEAVLYAKKNGVCVLFDPNYRPPLWDNEDAAREQTVWGLKRADIVKICDEEIEFLWGCDPLQGAVKLLDEYNIKMVMLTCGAGGAHLLTKKARVHKSCPPVKAIDTTGAGDIFAASAVHKMLELKTAPEELTEDMLYEIASFAVTASSISTQTMGGIPGIPDMVDVIAMM